MKFKNFKATSLASQKKKNRKRFYHNSMTTNKQNIKKCKKCAETTQAANSGEAFRFRSKNAQVK